MLVIIWRSYTHYNDLLYLHWPVLQLISLPFVRLFLLGPLQACEIKLDTNRTGEIGQRPLRKSWTACTSSSSRAKSYTSIPAIHQLGRDRLIPFVLSSNYQPDLFGTILLPAPPVGTTMRLLEIVGTKAELPLSFGLHCPQRSFQSHEVVVRLADRAGGRQGRLEE